MRPRPGCGCLVAVVSAVLLVGSALGSAIYFALVIHPITIPTP